MQQQFKFNCDLIQMQSEAKLTKQQSEEYNRLRLSQNGIDAQTFELSLKYYLEYRNNIGRTQTDKLQLVLKCALFMAEKSQRVSNLKGEKMTLPSLSLGQLLRSHPLDQVMITLKDFSRNVRVQDKQASADLTNLIKQISFLITFHKKFDKSVEKLQLRQRGNDTINSQYLKQWSSFAWLLYVQAKNKVLGKNLDLIQNTCMLAQSIAFMLTFAWDYAVPRALLRGEKRVNEQSSLKQIVLILRERVLEMFSIKTMEIFTSVATTFEDFFENDLASKGVIKTSNHANDFLSPELLPVNYRRLDRMYEKTMAANDLDQRIFFRDRLANLTPSKFTPFARQGYANKGRKIGKNDTTTYKQNFSSHRILNYEMYDKQQTTVKSQNPNMSRLPKTVLISPSTMKVPLICATPITAGMDMFNYINDKARKFKQLLAQGQIPRRPHEPAVFKHVEVLYQKSRKDFDKKTRQLREGLIYSLFKLALQDYFSQHPNQKDNENIYNAIMALSIQLVLFVCNSPLTFDDVEKQLGASPFQLWKATDFFLKFDKNMPSALKLHLLDIQVTLISYKLWKDNEMVEAIRKCANSDTDHKMDTMDRLFRRVLHQTAFQIQQMSNSLKLEESVQQNIFITLKHIFSQSPFLLLNSNIDQLIMCAIFANVKRQKLEIRFAQIIDTYTENNPHNKDIHDTIIFKIPKDNNSTINLITYYNDFFIHPLKEFILGQKLTLQPHNNQAKKNVNNVMQSPLKDILPRDLNRKNIKKNGKEGNTNLLIAYTDSPLLKHQPIVFKGQPLQAKKVINFDLQEQNFYKKDEEKNKQYEKLSPRHMVVNLPPQINKKFSVNNVPWVQPLAPSNISNINSLTPTRLQKGNTNGNFQLTQFTTNPTPPTNTQAKGGKNQQYIKMTAFNAGKNRTNFS